LPGTSSIPAIRRVIEAVGRARTECAQSAARERTAGRRPHSRCHAAYRRGRGAGRWAERYDRRIEDAFAVQDRCQVAVTISDSYCGRIVALHSKCWRFCARSLRVRRRAAGAPETPTVVGAPAAIGRVEQRLQRFSSTHVALLHNASLWTQGAKKSAMLFSASASPTRGITRWRKTLWQRHTVDLLAEVRAQLAQSGSVVRCESVIWATGSTLRKAR
jgi:hypothetical protein